MIGDPYATPLPGSYGYPTKPKPSGMPTQYQDTPPKHYEDGGPGQDGGDKFALPGGMPGAAPQMPPAPQSYAGMAGLDQLLQQRKASDDRRQMLAQMLAGQQQPQGSAPYANSPHPLDLPPPIAQASPWSIVAAAFNGLADGFRKSRQQQQQEENRNAGGGIVAGFGRGGS